MNEKAIDFLGTEFLEKIDNLLLLAKSHNIMIENCLSPYIEKIIQELNIGNIGSVWLSQCNANKEKHGIDAFLIQFSPTEEERKRKNIAYLQTSIGTGKFLNRKLCLHYYESTPEYLSRIIIPILKDFFINFGFHIVLSEKELN
jgi:hypothetical protein